MADFLSQAEIESLIEKYSRTPAGKSEIRAAMDKKKKKFVARFQGDSGYKMSASDRAEMRTKAEQMKSILHKHITQDTGIGEREGLINFPESAIVIGNPKAIGNTGNYEVSISFDAEALRRSSLDPTNYPAGITDIIKLFVRGYDAKGSVFGEWHGEQHASLRHREPNSFMSDAVQEFNDNNKDGSVVAVLTTKYK